MYFLQIFAQLSFHRLTFVIAMGFPYSWVILEVYFNILYPIANLPDIFYKSIYLLWE